MSKLSSRSFIVPFATGVLGGSLVMGASLALIVASGWRGELATQTVTIQEAPVVSAGASRETRELTTHEIYERDAPGVVFVRDTGVSKTPSTAELIKGEDGEQGITTGSGFEVNGAGMILTNWHVVENGGKVTVSFGESGKTVEAHVVRKDPSNDVAVLHISTDGLSLHPLVLGDSSAVQVGEAVLAIGNPLGYSRTLTTGVISGLRRQIQAPNGVTINNALQTDAPINPGNSGGPLLNTHGQVIGINSQIATSGSNGGGIGIAFAIPIDAAKRNPALGMEGKMGYGSR